MKNYNDDVKENSKEDMKENIELLIEKFSPLVNKLSSKYNVNNMVKEDLIQEGNLAILNAVEKFNYEKDLKFIDGYIITSIKNAYKQLLRKNNKHNNEFSLNNSVSDGGEYIDMLVDDFNIEDNFISDEVNIKLINALKNLEKSSLQLIKYMYFTDNPNLSKYCRENDLIYFKCRKNLKETLKTLKNSL